jgi:hypothetical protein
MDVVGVGGGSLLVLIIEASHPLHTHTIGLLNTYIKCFVTCHRGYRS